jgi:hypothetical protein
VLAVSLAEPETGSNASRIRDHQATGLQFLTKGRYVCPVTND